MQISDRAIETPRLVILAGIIICLMGFMSLATLPKERTPRVQLPVIICAVANPGAPPAENESEIIRRIEDEIKQNPLKGLKEEAGIQSEAVNNAAVLVFVFEDTVNVTEAKRDVTDLINRVKSEFPVLAQRDPGPIINDVAFEDWPIIQVVVSGGESDYQRRRIAEALELEIEKIGDISGVDLFGGADKEVLIEADPRELAIKGISFQMLQGAINQNNLQAPSGEINLPSGQEWRVRTKGKYATLNTIAKTPLVSSQTGPLRLEDVAEVAMADQSQDSISSYGDKDAVVLMVRARTGIDMLKTANEVQAVVDEFNRLGRDGPTTISTIQSQARDITYMLQQLGGSAIYGLCLVIVILWIAMGWRNAFLISMSVPFAMMAAIAISWFFKRSIFPDLAINNMALFATILTIGMVVDGCIIVGENTYRHRELGHSPLESAKRGINEVGGSLISAYLTTFAAFGPMFIVRGVMGDFMKQLPIVVMLTLIGAMLVDHFLLPVLSVYFMKSPRPGPRKLAQEVAEDQDLPQKLGQENAKDESISEKIGADGLSAQDQKDIQDFETSLHQSAFRRRYINAIENALSHRLLILFLIVGMIATPISLYRSGAIGTEFFPEGESFFLEVNFELPLGAEMETRTRDVSQTLVKLIKEAMRDDELNRPSDESPPVEPVVTIGRPDALSINLQERSGVGPEFGKIYLELALPEDRERSTDEIVAAIEKAIREAKPESTTSGHPLTGVTIRTSAFQEGPPAGADIAVRVLAREDRGVTFDEMSLWASKLEKWLAGTKGVIDLQNDYRLRPEVEIIPNRTLSQMKGVSVADIAQTVHFNMEGLKISEVDFGGDENFDVRLKAKRAFRDSIDDLEDLPVMTQQGTEVPLAQVAELKTVRSSNVLRHYDGQRVINITSDLEKGFLIDNVRESLIKKLNPAWDEKQVKRLKNDMGNKIIYSDDRIVIEFGGENEVRDDALEDLTMAMIIAMAAMAVILVVKFNSFIQPLVILFSVPLSLVGVAIGLMLCGMNFSVAAMIGVVALTGIVVNDAIVLVDFVNQIRAKGIKGRKALIYAGALRLRPILITTVTTIGGLLPLGLNLTGGGEFFQPLTVSIMFGLGFATLLQLFIIPIMLDIFDSGERDGLLDPARHPRLSKAS